MGRTVRGRALAELVLGLARGRLARGELGEGPAATTHLGPVLLVGPMGPIYRM